MFDKEFFSQTLAVFIGVLLALWAARPTLKKMIDKALDELRSMR